MRSLSDWQGKGPARQFLGHLVCAMPPRDSTPEADTGGPRQATIFRLSALQSIFPEQVQAYAEEAQFNYPILVGQEDAMAAAEASGIDFIGMPFTMIVAPSGELLKTHIGEIVESHIDKILDVFDELETGSMDVAAARAALVEL